MTKENGQSYDLVDPETLSFPLERFLLKLLSLRGSLVPPKAGAERVPRRARRKEMSSWPRDINPSQSKGESSEALSLVRFREDAFSFIAPPEAVSLSPLPPSLAITLGWLVSGAGKFDTSYDTAAYAKGSDVLAIGPMSMIGNGNLTFGLDGGMSLASAFNASLKLEAAMRGQSLVYYDPQRIPSRQRSTRCFLIRPNKRVPA